MQKAKKEKRVGVMKTVFLRQPLGHRHSALYAGHAQRLALCLRPRGPAS